jgi:hypothetical protein
MCVVVVERDVQFWRECRIGLHLQLFQTMMEGWPVRDVVLQKAILLPTYKVANYIK